MPYDLPAGWTWARFSDVAIIASNLVNPNDYPDFPHLAPDNIQKGTGVLLPCATVREDNVISANHRFYPGQIVYSKIRPKLAKVVVVDFDGLCSADMYPINALIDARFLHRYMLCGTFLSQAVKADTRVAMPKINQEELNAVAVPVPPLAEQKRIVAKVDELMALCDALEAQQQERDTRRAALSRAALARFAEAPTAENLEFLFQESCSIEPAAVRKLVLTMAVHGKLVAHDPEDEPAAAMVSRVNEARVVKKAMGGLGSLTEIPPDNCPFDLPHNWVWARFQDVADIASNLVHPAGYPSHPHLAPDNIQKETGVLLPCATVREDNVISANHLFFPGQIVYSKIRPRLAKVVVVDFEGLCSADMYPINAKIDTRYLQRYMLSDAFLKQAIKSDTRVAMPKINQTELNAVLVSVPPLAEQCRIVAKVDELMALVDQLEAELAAARAKGEKLLEAAVAQCGTGFDPAEPAEPAAPDTGEADGFLPGMSAHYRESDVVRRRARVAAYLVHEFKADPHFHRTKLEKLNHLIEYHCGVELRRTPIRDERGPNDFPALREAEDFAGDAAQGWFTVHANPDGYGYDYRPGPRLAAAAEEQRRAFGEKLPDVQRLLTLMRDKTTGECEIIATLYAAWNDLLLASHKADDGAIIREARENWHPSKKKISQADWRVGLEWMRTNQIIPRGTGRPVVLKR